MIMNKDQKIMLIVAIAALLCTIWAITIPDLGIIVMSPLVAIFAFYMIFKMKKR